MCCPSCGRVGYLSCMHVPMLCCLLAGKIPLLTTLTSTCTKHSQTLVHISTVMAAGLGCDSDSEQHLPIRWWLGTLMHLFRFYQGSWGRQFGSIAIHGNLYVVCACAICDRIIHCRTNVSLRRRCLKAVVLTERTYIHVVSSVPMSPSARSSQSGFSSIEYAWTLHG
jgi:hypothetical protein